MPGKDNVILDSDILINYSKEEIDLDYYFQTYRRVYISVITYLEVFGFDFKHISEEKLLNDIMKKIEMISINESIIEKVIEVRKKFKVKLPDAIIFSTSVYLNADLITFNEKDFRNLI